MEPDPSGRGSLSMTKEIDSGEAVRMMMHIGALLRLNMRDLQNEPMKLQVMHQMRSRPERDGLAALALVPYEPLPDELRGLLEQFADQ